MSDSLVNTPGAADALADIPPEEARLVLQGINELRAAYRKVTGKTISGGTARLFDQTEARALRALNPDRQGCA
jgi:hypothetical protein